MFEWVLDTPPYVFNLIMFSGSIGWVGLGCHMNHISKSQPYEVNLKRLMSLRLILINPFIPNASFLYPLERSENLTVFKGVEKGCIWNK